jgi:excinuclease UvrABC nuclease subunit
MTYDEFNEIRVTIPEQPGIYRYFDKENQLEFAGCRAE